MKWSGMLLQSLLGSYLFRQLKIHCLHFGNWLREQRFLKPFTSFIFSSYEIVFHQLSASQNSHQTNSWHLFSKNSMFHNVVNVSLYEQYNFPCNYVKLMEVLTGLIHIYEISGKITNCIQSWVFHRSLRSSNGSKWKPDWKAEFFPHLQQSETMAT